MNDSAPVVESIPPVVASPLDPMRGRGKKRLSHFKYAESVPKLKPIESRRDSNCSTISIPNLLIIITNETPKHTIKSSS